MRTKFSIDRKTTPKRSFRVESVCSQFDLQTHAVAEHFEGDLALPKEWSVGVIYGASGTGKTTIAKELFKKDYVRAFKYGKQPVIDEMPSELAVTDVTRCFNSVGFATVWSWLKPYDVLSTGEQMRVDLARAILSDRKRIVFDEFTSVVNREVAKAGSFALQKAVRKSGKQFIAVTCHRDVLEWLEPDWTFCTDSMTFERGSLRRPELTIEVERTDRTLWKLFQRFHYLNTSLNPSAHCYVARLNGVPVAFFAVLHLLHHIHRTAKRGHRLVVLPDYQGLGIGHALSSHVAQRYLDKGHRFFIASATKSLFRQRQRDPRWKIIRASRNPSHKGTMRGTSSASRYTYGYEYIGKRAKS